jgi:hypothetical protein
MEIIISPPWKAPRDVEFQIGVMHPMEPPEAGHNVKHYVLTVDGQIEEHHSSGDDEPGGEGDQVEQTPAFGVGQECHVERSERQQQTQHDRVEHNGAKLFGHRRVRRIDCGRRGASNSQSAMSRSAPITSPAG